ncbi:hypothetical protein AB0D65_29740 [Streptomyces griseoloalbus]|uniref:Uncharacterized protein n=1 Tax=Streptomyces griseoloalbus TaxID=67303 RepID=A0ABV3ED67_9ACTN
MSTPAPDPAPFDPHAFPTDLVAAQRQAAELYAALHAHQATLPWSREPHEGWPDETERGRERPGRPASPGWTAEQAAEFDRLMEELRTVTAVVQSHKWWERCAAEGIKGADMVAARQALKHAKGAVPLVREDVDAAA